MANSKITLDVGTKYNGEGMKKLDNSIKSSAARMKRSAKEWGSAHRSAAKTATLAWTEFYSKVKVITGAISTAWGALKSIMSQSFNFETQTMAFKTLIGNIDDAKKHMQDLKELGDTPPFSLDEFAKASRQLMVMTDGVLGMKGSLEIIGDAAAATGQDLESLGHSVGLLYATIRDGQPIGRAANQLRNVGVLTPEIVKQLDDMQKSGASAAEMWELVEKSLKKYEGAMKETETTGNGLIGAIGSKWDNIVRQFGDAFTDVAHGGLKDALDAMQKLEDSGFARWLGDTLLTAATKTTNALTALFTQLKEGAQFWREFFGGAKSEAQGAVEAIERTLVEEKKTNDFTTMRKFKNSDGTEEYEYEIDEKKKREVEDKQRRADEKKKIRETLLQSEREREEKQFASARETSRKQVADESTKVSAMVSSDPYKAAEYTQKRENAAKQNLKSVQDEIADIEQKILEAQKNQIEGYHVDIKVPAPKIEQQDIKVPDNTADNLDSLEKKLRELKNKEIIATEELNEATKQNAQVQEEAAIQKQMRDRKAAEAFVSAQEEEAKAEKLAKDRQDAQQKLKDAQENGAKVQKELNDKIAQAKNAVNDMIANFESGAGRNFGDWNKAQNNAARGMEAVNGVVDANGNPLMVDKKQLNAVNSNKRLLDRITKRYDKDGDGNISEDEMAKMDDRTKKEFQRRKDFDDNFNPKKLAKKQEELNKLEKQKAEQEAKMRKDVDEINKRLKNLGL